MLPDNRLDHISNIGSYAVECMTALRKEFISLDQKLRELGSIDVADREGVKRCLSIARTNIETACQYSIKALCLIGEIKE